MDGRNEPNFVPQHVAHAIAMTHENGMNGSMDAWLQTRATDNKNNDRMVEIKNAHIHTHTFFLSEVELSQYSRVEPAVYTRMAQLCRSFHRSRGTSQSTEEAPATDDANGKAGPRANYLYVASAPTNRLRFLFAL